MTELTDDEVKALLDPFASRSGTEALRKLRAAAPDLARALLATRAELAAAKQRGAALVEAATPYVQPVQNADYGRQLRQHEALVAALAPEAIRQGDTP